MKKHRQEQQEVNRVWNQIEPRELDLLRADMNKKTQVRMNGRLQSRWTQVMLDRGVLKLDQWGDKIMVSPAEYKKWQKAEYMLIASDEKEQARLFRENPELEVEAKERFQNFLKETRELVFNKKIKT